MSAGSWPRPTVRLRLTLLYGALFLACGTLLVALSVVLFRHGFEQSLNILPPPPPFGASTPSVQDLATRELVTQSAIALGVMAVVSGGLGWWMAGRVLRPLQRITATARSLTDRRLHERIAMGGPDDELRELADTFDALLDRLEASFDGQRRFVANASHELRTPLAVQRTLLEVALDDPDASAAALRQTAREVLQVTARSEHLIDDLLVLARGSHGSAAGMRVDLADVVRRAAEQELHAAGPADLRCALDCHPVLVEGHEELLGHLAANLVQNAIRHNQAGGWFEVATRSLGGKATLTVRNSGPRVRPEELNGLFEPFRRLGDRRTGPWRGGGLGLSIVKAVAELHGGAVRAEALPAGGLSVRVELPLAPAAP